MINEKIEILSPIVERLLNYVEIGLDSENDYLYQSADNIESPVNNIVWSMKHFLRRKISWKALCLEIENEIDNLDFSSPKEGWFDGYTTIDGKMCDVSYKYHPDILPIFIESNKILNEFFKLIDSGNRKEAELCASQDYAK